MSIFAHPHISRVKVLTHSNGSVISYYVMWDRTCVQHLVKPIKHVSGMPDFEDVSDISNMIGKLVSQIITINRAKKDIWGEAIAEINLYCEGDLDLWLTSRWEFFKSYTQDHYVSSRIINSLREVLNNAQQD